MDTMELVSYDVSKFNPKPSSELLCAICHCVLYKPRMCPCHHIFCQSCIETWLNRSSSCPSCRSYTTLHFLQLAPPLVQNVLNGLTMDCDYKEKGCDVKVPMESFPSHLQNCDYRATRCPHKGCCTETTVRDLSQHTQECKYRSVQCDKQCKLHFPAHCLDTHGCLPELQNKVHELDGILQRHQTFLSWIRHKLNNADMPHQSMDVQFKGFRDMLVDINRYWCPNQPVPLSLCGDYMATGAGAATATSGGSERGEGQEEPQTENSQQERLIQDDISLVAEIVPHTLTDSPTSPDHHMAMNNAQNSPRTIPHSPSDRPTHDLYSLSPVFGDQGGRRFGYQRLRPQQDDEVDNTREQLRSIYNEGRYQSAESSTSHSPFNDVGDYYPPDYASYIISPSQVEDGHDAYEGSRHWEYQARESPSDHVQSRNYSRSRSYSPWERNSRSRRSRSTSRSYSPHARRNRTRNYSRSRSYSRDRDYRRSRSQTRSQSGQSVSDDHDNHLLHSPRLPSRSPSASPNRHRHSMRSGSVPWSQSCSPTCSSPSYSDLTTTRDDSLNDNGEWEDYDESQYRSSDDRTDLTPSEWENSNDSTQTLDNSGERETPNGSDVQSELSADEEEDAYSRSDSPPYVQSSPQQRRYSDSSSDAHHQNYQHAERRESEEMSNCDLWDTPVHDHIAISTSHTTSHNRHHSQRYSSHHRNITDHLDNDVSENNGQDMFFDPEVPMDRDNSQSCSDEAEEAYVPPVAGHSGEGENIEEHIIPYCTSETGAKSQPSCGSVVSLQDPSVSVQICNTAVASGRQNCENSRTSVERKSQDFIAVQEASSAGDSMHSSLKDVGETSSVDRSQKSVSCVVSKSTFREQEKKHLDQDAALNTWESSSDTTSLDYDIADEEGELFQITHSDTDNFGEEKLGCENDTGYCTERAEASTSGNQGSDPENVEHGSVDENKINSNNEMKHSSQNEQRKGKGKRSSRGKGKAFKKGKKGLKPQAEIGSECGNTDSDSNICFRRSSKTKVTYFPSDSSESEEQEPDSRQSKDDECTSTTSTANHSPSTSRSAVYTKESVRKNNLTKENSISNRSLECNQSKSREKDPTRQETRSKKRKAFETKHHQPSKKPRQDNKSNSQTESESQRHIAEESHNAIRHDTPLKNVVMSDSSRQVSLLVGEVGASYGGGNVNAAFHHTPTYHLRTLVDTRPERADRQSGEIGGRNLPLDVAAKGRGGHRPSNREAEGWRGDGHAHRDHGIGRQNGVAVRPGRAEGTTARPSSRRVMRTESGHRRSTSDHPTRTVVITDVPIPPSSYELLNQALDSEDSSDSTWTPSSSKSESSV